MRLTRKRLLGLLLASALILSLLTACNTTEENNTEAEVKGNGNANTNQAVNVIAKSTDLNQYIINAELNTDKKLLTVGQKVRYINNESVELKELYFHVYSNAFKSKETAPFLFDSFSDAYPRGFEPGYTEMLSISDQNKNNMSYSFQGEGETILKLELTSPLKPKEVIELDMSYIVHIPPASERFGWGANNYNLGNWYPIAAVYDEKDGWNLDKYFAIGDPFYSDVADYSVTIETPKNYIVASSGRLIEDKIEGESRSWKFEANKMRDFAFIANNKFEVAEENVDGTIVKSYYYSDDSERGKKALTVGVNSIRLFNQKFGKYPYPSYSVVETEFPSGMEYPGLVYISERSYDRFSSEEWFTVVIVHETAHQWWYSLVGNDQIDEAWLDESFASYSEKIYDEEYIGINASDRSFARNENVLYSDVGSLPVVRSLYEFKNWDDYGPIAYTKGSVVLNELRSQVGDEAFFKILQTYFQNYEFKNATTEDFMAVSEAVYGSDLDEFFNKWLYAK